jgi:uncharacterized membrane protein
VTASIPTLRSSRPAPGKTNTARQWLPPVGLIVLSLIPVLAGAMRLNELMGSPQVTANNARFVASPIPITMHIVSVTVYSLLGAVQFVPSLRRRTSSWHRIAGRILVPAGVLVALSGLWMSAFYPRPAGDGESLVVVRLMFGSAMFASIVLAVLAIRRRDFASHGAWMTRGYAIALGAGTQVFTLLPWVVVFGPIGAADELPRTVLMTAGWVINLGVAEYVIRRPERRSRKPSVEFDFRHCAFEPEQEAVIEDTRMVNAVGIGHERVTEGILIERLPSGIWGKRADFLLCGGIQKLDMPVAGREGLAHIGAALLGWNHAGVLGRYCRRDYRGTHCGFANHCQGLGLYKLIGFFDKRAERSDTVTDFLEESNLLINFPVPQPERPNNKKHGDSDDCDEH